MATVTSTLSKNIQVTGNIEIDGIQVKGFSATINTDNPTNIEMSNWITNQELYKVNRTAVNQEQLKLEDAAYAEQDRLTLEMEAK